MGRGFWVYRSTDPQITHRHFSYFTFFYKDSSLACLLKQLLMPVFSSGSPAKISSSRSKWSNIPLLIETFGFFCFCIIVFIWYIILFIWYLFDKAPGSVSSYMFSLCLCKFHPSTTVFSPRPKTLSISYSKLPTDVNECKYDVYNVNIFFSLVICSSNIPLSTNDCAAIT